MTTITKILEPGKWRLRPKDGYHVTAVRLVGLRGRRHDLINVDQQYFARFLPELRQETPVHRGTPNTYTWEAPYLMLWPAPAHTWKLEMDIKERTKVKV